MPRTGRTSSINLSFGFPSAISCAHTFTPRGSKPRSTTRCRSTCSPVSADWGIRRGYVGLPLAVEFAKAGLHVVGYDVDQSKIDALTAGNSYIPDVPSKELQE